ncbi:MAG: cupin-like domain-containing protein [Cytophagales bacterium]|nr:cupin-like domain-containing protein [Cytophagales bacterium]
MEVLQINTVPILDELDWDRFMEEFWDKSPVIIKGFSKQPVLTQEDLLKLVQLQGNRILDGKTAELTLYDKHRVSLSGTHASRRYLTGIEPYLPDGQEKHLSDYLFGLTEHERFNEFCLYSNAPHTYEHIWKAMRPVFKLIFEGTKISPAGMNTDLFIGNYQRTNFGAHRDQLSNFMFMLFGTRRMLLWSDHVWKNVLGNPDNNKLIVHDYEAFRSEALVAELSPGDVLYWPMEYWHVGENDGKLSGSINVDYVQPDKQTYLDSVLTQALSKVVRQESANHRTYYDLDYFVFEPDQQKQMDLPDNLEQRYNLLIENFDKESLYEFFLNSEWTRKMSAMGFNKGLKPRTSVLLSSSTNILSDADFPVFFKRYNDKMILSHSGVSKVLDMDSTLLSMVQYVNNGWEGSVLELHERLSQNGSYEEETFYNHLAALYEIHAIEIISA